jgi:subtilisin family serine protease
VLDSGVDFTHADLAGHVVAVNVNQAASGPTDGFGHGTHVAGVIVGQDAAGQYVGIAPGADLVSVKISDDAGVTHESDVLRGIQWVSQHRTNYNIRAINLSLSASVPQSYATSPIDAAVENVWRQGVTVVASAGNLGRPRTRSGMRRATTRWLSPWVASMTTRPSPPAMTACARSAAAAQPKTASASLSWLHRAAKS